MRVLISDDEGTIRGLLEEYLSMNGYKVVSTVDGFEAWEILKEGTGPPLVILDWMMPRMTGLELCRELRKNPATRDTYVLLLSARHTKNEIVLAFNAGCDDYVIKPFDLEELLARLAAGERRLVEQRGFRNIEQPTRVLISEDDPTSLLLLETILKREGYEVIPTRDGFEAWEILKEGNGPPLAILDWMLPRLDGLELCRELRKKPATRGTHVLLLSVKSAKKEIVMALNAGCDDYITKPFVREELLARLAVGVRRLKEQNVARDLVENQGEEYIGLGLFGDKIKLVSATEDGHYRFLDGLKNYHKILYLVSSQTIALQRAIDELEYLVNSQKAKEQDFQEFFDRNPDFILTEEYKRAHPQVVLGKDTGESLVPDFVLEPVDQNSLCGLLELKLPTSPVFVLKKNRQRFSAAVLEARAQLLEYSRFFDEKKNREAIYQRYGLQALNPKMILIIGRIGKIDPFERRKIEVSESDLNLFTYDDVINRAKTRVERMKKGQFR